MIPALNYFSGALGKTMNPGGSHFMTTPHTRLLQEPDYTIPVSGTFVCCSLNGRLWVFREEGAYRAVALKWNASDGRLELAASRGLGSAFRPLARGLDWVLSDTQTLQAIDESPYIVVSKPTDPSIGDEFLYSILRAPVFSGDSTGYFSTVNGLSLYDSEHSMEACYSTLPSVGDWNIVEDFLVRRPANPLETVSGDFLLQARPLIPLEALNDTPALNSRGIQVAASGHELWGRGAAHIGRAFIIPAVFEENGEARELYLYIGGKGPFAPSGDYSWLDVGVSALRKGESESDVPVGFVSEKKSPVVGSICQTAATGQVLLDGQWITPRPDDTVKLAFDPMNGTGLALGRTGVTFLSVKTEETESDDAGEETTEEKNISLGDDFNCSGLSEWLAPAGQVESISLEQVIGSFDNAALLTRLPKTFDRLLLTQRTLPLAWGIFEQAHEDEGEGETIQDARYRLSMGQENGSITVTNLPCSEDEVVPVDNIPWEEVYKEPVKIRLLNHIEIENPERLSDVYEGPMLITKRDVEIQDHYYESWDEYVSWPVRAHFEMLFFNPDTGEATPASYDIDFTGYYDHIPHPNKYEGVDYVAITQFPYFNEEGKMQIWLSLYEGYGAGYGYSSRRSVFVDVENVLPDWWEPDAWLRYDSIYYYDENQENAGLELTNGWYFPETLVTARSTRDGLTLPRESPCYPHVLFTEHSTRAKFLMRVPSFGSLSADGTATGVMSHLLDRASGVYFNSLLMTYRNGELEDYQGDWKSRNTLHLWVTYNFASVTDMNTGLQTQRVTNAHVFTFRADIVPEDLDFDSDIS